nr:MAG TPA: hypothetical protein [Caudoviricetes sp.]
MIMRDLLDIWSNNEYINICSHYGSIYSILLLLHVVYID